MTFSLKTSQKWGGDFIHIDEKQSHYIKVMCDEIFKEENFMNENGEIVYGNHPTTDSRFDVYLRKYIKAHLKINN